MAEKKGTIVLDDSELWEIKKRYEELEKKYKAKRAKDPDAKMVDSARAAAGLKK